METIISITLILLFLAAFALLINSQFKYVQNLKTGEIHRRNSRYIQCNIKKIRNKKYLTESQKKKRLNSGRADGCKYCLPEAHTNKKKD